jgi:ribosomal protein L37AE/L43A
MLPWLGDAEQIRAVKFKNMCPFCKKDNTVEKRLGGESSTGPPGPDGKLREADKIWFGCLKERGGCGEPFCISKSTFENIERTKEEVIENRDKVREVYKLKNCPKCGKPIEGFATTPSTVKGVSDVILANCNHIIKISTDVYNRIKDELNFPS